MHVYIVYTQVGVHVHVHCIYTLYICRVGGYVYIEEASIVILIDECIVNTLSGCSVIP